MRQVWRRSTGYMTDLPGKSSRVPPEPRKTRLNEPLSKVLSEPHSISAEQKPQYRYNDPKAAFAEAQRRIRRTLQSCSEALDLRGLGLTKLPESLNQLTDIREISFDENRLRELPECLGTFSRLEVLFA